MSPMPQTPYSLIPNKPPEITPKPLPRDSESRLIAIGHGAAAEAARAEPKVTTFGLLLGGIFWGAQLHVALRKG